MDDVCISVLNILTLRYTFPIKTASDFDRRKNTFYTYSIYHTDTLPNYEKRQKYIFIFIQKSTHKIDPKVQKTYRRYTKETQPR